MWRIDSLEKTLMLGKTEGRGGAGDRGWDGWMAYQLNGHDFEQFWEIVKDREAWHAIQSLGSQRVGHDSVTKQQQCLGRQKTAFSRYMQQCESCVCA